MESHLKNLRTKKEQGAVHLTLTQPEAGKLTVHLHRATDVKPMDHNYFSDPFVQLTLEGCKPQKSKVVKHSLTAVFDQEFHFHSDQIPAPGMPWKPLELKVEVLDWDPKGTRYLRQARHLVHREKEKKEKHELLGVATLDVSEAKQEVQIEVALSTSPPECPPPPE